MLKLTERALRQAWEAAREIRALESSKDNISDEPAYCQVHDVQVQVPASFVRAEIDRRLRAAHTRLEAMGIELAPPDPASRPSPLEC